MPGRGFYSGGKPRIRRHCSGREWSHRTERVSTDADHNRWARQTNGDEVVCSTMKDMQSASTTPSGMTQLAMRIFVALSVVLILAFGLFSIESTIRETSPLSRLTERMERAPWFESIRSEWSSDWSLLSLEDAPWVSTVGSPLPIASINPMEGVLVVNLWATWCEPCRKEMPAMLKLARDVRPAGVRFLFLSYDEEWEAPERLFKAVHGKMPSYVAVARDPLGKPGASKQHPDSFWARLGATALPETFFIKNGRVLGKVIGAIDWSQADIRRYLTELSGRQT